MNLEYKIKIDAFEGPLDLLLHLIKQLEIDIYDIPVAEITEQYLEFIHQMKVLELDVASEYLVMAATLIAMKSKMLLPKQEPEELYDEEDVIEEDPREELMNRLIEYKQYKQAAEQFKTFEQVQSEQFSKPTSDLKEYKQQLNGSPPPMIGPRATIFDMLGAFQRLMKKKKLMKPLKTKIERNQLPIGQRMVEIVDVLEESKTPLTFESLFTYPDRTHIVVTFLAMLELMKKHQIYCIQEDNFDEITISLVDGREHNASKTDNESYY
ncbi:segregation/condensation protein A [Terrilactibacillus laevilacticus]|uniref:Segregation and condensation protein A n=1 Tax=Terrilactibacillus laevilacticus TaxID=1380157 RepID=A0ABW5PS82_9BACI|nr:segregation/condensation protein A [Terrilactibacillus laevilacticus]